jgi:tetratricopeptide (TPR) repeat protein
VSAPQLRERMAEAVTMREAGQLEAARRLLMQLHDDDPGDAEINLQCAWIHDKLGFEREAVLFYESALRLGLDGEDLKHALLGLGSTYRSLGRYAEALDTLTKGVGTFPEDRSMQVFQAMALYNSGEAKEACQLLLQIVSTTTADEGVRSYRRAIDIYAADLDRMW